MSTAMSTPAAVDLRATYRALRRIIAPYESSFAVVKATPTAFYLASKTAKTRSGAPVWFGGVQIMKNYVSFHLIPIYADPSLEKTLSPVLRKRMQGKSCFNFTTLDPSQRDELTALTRKGFESFRRQHP
jgi:hypothetical protein